MINFQRKSAFSMVETFVFITVISIFLAAAVPMISKKARTAPNIAAHGTYLCYYDESGKLTQEYYNANNLTSRTYPSKCTFEPKDTAIMHKIELIGAGSGGKNVYGTTSSNEVKSSEGTSDD